jgi:hypothetical protein
MFASKVPVVSMLLDSAWLDAPCARVALQHPSLSFGRRRGCKWKWIPTVMVDRRAFSSIAAYSGKCGMFGW